MQQHNLFFRFTIYFTDMIGCINGEVEIGDYDKEKKRLSFPLLFAN